MQVQTLPASVEMILQATIGGNALFFKVSALSGRVFKFSVASKEVGLAIRKLVSFECDLFKLFFHLWGGGGQNWRLELASFLEEDRLSWQLPKQASKPSFAEVVCLPPGSATLSGANAIPIGSVHAARLFVSPFSDAFLSPEVRPSFVLLLILFVPSSGGEVQPWLPIIAPDASPQGTSDVTAVGQSGVAHATPLGM